MVFEHGYKHRYIPWDTWTHTNPHESIF